jgi:hypothetical protein
MVQEQVERTSFLVSRIAPSSAVELATKCATARGGARLRKRCEGSVMRWHNGVLYMYENGDVVIVLSNADEHEGRIWSSIVSKLLRDKM